MTFNLKQYYYITRITLHAFGYHMIFLRDNLIDFISRSRAPLLIFFFKYIKIFIPSIKYNYTNF